MADPSEKDLKLIGEVQQNERAWREHRRSHESTWFVCASALRGDSYVMFDTNLAQLIVPPAPTHRQRLRINRIRPKTRAYLARFFKDRPRPEIIPATTEREDVLNARGTQKALEYLWRKQDLEGKYRRAKVWTTIGGKGFWWLSWDPTIKGRVRTTHPILGAPVIEEAELGDVRVEVGTPFEVLVADPMKTRIGEQPKIMRITRRPLEEVKARYPKKAKDLTGEGTGTEIFGYARQIANLHAHQSEPTFSGTPVEKHQTDYIIVREQFERPTAEFPKGRYIVVAGDTLVKVQEELPYGFYDLENPYPCEDFSDLLNVGQFWGTSFVEQLLDPQREYNLIRSKVAEQIRMMAHPKLIVYTQHRLPKGAWTSESGEIVTVHGIPGLPPPQVVQPGNIAPDAWQALSLLRQEFDDLTQIYPVTEGKTGSTTSGFQANLLQEAAESVHTPDIQEDHRSIERILVKVRRLMKQGYDVQRLITVAGRNAQPEVMEFSGDQVDEYADVVIQTGSALPTLKAARVQALLELGREGWLGNPQEPETKKRFLSHLDMGSLEIWREEDRVDEDQAWRENQLLQNGQPVPDAQFFEDHGTHLRVHGVQAKSAEYGAWSEEQQTLQMAHMISHVQFINPKFADQLKQQYGLAPPAPPAAPQPPPAQPQPPPGPSPPGGPIVQQGPGPTPA